MPGTFTPPSFISLSIGKKQSIPPWLLFPVVWSFYRYKELTNRRMWSDYGHASSEERYKTDRCCTGTFSDPCYADTGWSLCRKKRKRTSDRYAGYCWCICNTGILRSRYFQKTARHLCAAVACGRRLNSAEFRLLCRCGIPHYLDYGESEPSVDLGDGERRRKMVQFLVRYYSGR